MKYTIDTEKKEITLLEECSYDELHSILISDKFNRGEGWKIVPCITINTTPYIPTYPNYPTYPWDNWPFYTTCKLTTSETNE